MKYSFVLPAYKARFFKEALDSILNQTYKEFELIIVNDASPENLDIIVNGYVDSRIRYYVNEKNIGGHNLIAQWNYSLSYARGEYIILASDDDIYHPEYLEKMNILVDNYPDVNVFRPRIQWIDHNGDTTNIDISHKERMSQIEFANLWIHRQISSGIPFYLFKKEALNEIGGFVNFPVAWFSDDATVIKLSKNGIIITNELLFSFRNSGINLSTSCNNLRMLYRKLLSTELFYEWFTNELKHMMHQNKSEVKIIKAMYSIYPLSRNHNVVCLLHNSFYNQNFIACWRILNKFKSINCINRIKILFRIFVLKKLKKNVHNMLRIIK